MVVTVRILKYSKNYNNRKSNKYSSNETVLEKENSKNNKIRYLTHQRYIKSKERRAFTVSIVFLILFLIDNFSHYFLSYINEVDTTYLNITRFC